MLSFMYFVNSIIVVVSARVDGVDMVGRSTRDRYNFDIVQSNNIFVAPYLHISRAGVMTDVIF